MKYYKFYYEDQYFKSTKDLLDDIKNKSSKNKYGIVFLNEDQLKNFKLKNKRMIYEETKLECLFNKSYWLLVLEN